LKNVDYMASERASKWPGSWKLKTV